MELEAMANIGTEMARKLRAAGIHSAEELTAAGAEEAFLRLKVLCPQACLVHLYALEGAIENVAFNSLDGARKRELKAFSDRLRGTPGRKSIRERG